MNLRKIIAASAAAFLHFGALPAQAGAEYGSMLVFGDPVSTGYGLPEYRTDSTEGYAGQASASEKKSLSVRFITACAAGVAAAAASVAVLFKKRK